jgi:hypothetical protein
VALVSILKPQLNSVPMTLFIVGGIANTAGPHLLHTGKNKKVFSKDI